MSVRSAHQRLYRRLSFRQSKDQPNQYLAAVKSEYTFMLALIDLVVFEVIVSAL